MFEIWTDAVRSIEPLVKPAHRDRWLRPIECIAIDEGRIRLRAPNRYHKEWFEDNFLSSILGDIQARTQRAERDRDLAARRPRQELAERDDIDVTGLVEPAAALDQFSPEIAQMRYRAAEAGAAEPQKGEEDRDEARCCPGAVLRPQVLRSRRFCSVMVAAAT